MYDFSTWSAYDFALVGGIISAAIGIMGCLLWMVHDEQRQAIRRKRWAEYYDQLRIDRLVDLRLQQAAMMEDKQWQTVKRPPTSHP